MKLPRLFKHRHKWQVRGRNLYGKPTYKKCLKCGKHQKWAFGMNGKFIDCDPIPELDDQFDEKNKYIFK